MAAFSCSPRYLRRIRSHEIVRCGVCLLTSLVLGLSGRSSENSEAWPDLEWSLTSAAEAGLDEALVRRARDYALTGEGSGMVTRGGRLVLSWGDVDKRYDLKSTSKSIGVTALGLAVADGKLRLDDLASEHHPSLGVPPASNAGTGWIGEITIRHLATQTAGFAKPGGYTELLFRPGSQWLYSDGGPNWLAECVTLAYQRDIEDLMFERIFRHLGLDRGDLRWRSHAYRDPEIEGVARREFGSGVHADVDAMARLGLLYLREGRWKNEKLLPASFIEEATSTVESVVGLEEMDAEVHGNASDHYGMLWWNNADGTLEGVPRDAYWSWGLYDSLILVIPSLDLVVSRAGDSWKREGGDHYEVLRPFFEPLVQAVRVVAEGDGENAALPEQDVP